MYAEQAHVDVRRLMGYLAHRPQTPAAELNRIEVTIETIPQGSTVPVVSMRNAIFMFQKPTTITVSEPLDIRHLKEKGQGTWMTDSPQEVWQMDYVIREAWGNVLVGGLGLGVTPHLISKLNIDVSDVTVVEKNQSIVNLVEPHITVDEVVCNDLFQYVKEMPSDWHDFAFFDIWQPTGQIVWASQVVPLKRLCRNKIDEVVCWNEQEMIGQFQLHWSKYPDVDVEAIPAADIPMRVLRQAAVDRGWRKEPRITFDMLGTAEGLDKMMEVEIENQKDSQISELCSRLLLGPGTDEWEQEFGKLWDHFEEEERKVKYGVV